MVKLFQSERVRAGFGCFSLLPPRGLENPWKINLNEFDSYFTFSLSLSLCLLFKFGFFSCDVDFTLNLIRFFLVLLKIIKQIWFKYSLSVVCVSVLVVLFLCRCVALCSCLCVTFQELSNRIILALQTKSVSRHCMKLNRSHTHTHTHVLTN